jgi:lipoprotein NlpI
LALSLSELYFQAGLWDELATMPVLIENTDDLSAEVLRYKARALRETGMAQGALELLREALKTKKRHPEILKAARYERGLTYESLGKKALARKDLERLFAEDPGYLDVRERLTQSKS